MATYTPDPGPNIGASRLLGTNNLQQAADSLTSQVNKIASAIGNLTSSFQRMTGATGSTFSTSWNSGSNRANYSSNGGGGTFSFGSMNGAAANGGGGSFGSMIPMSRGGAAAGAVLGVASALTNYANRNMSTNMQADYFNTRAAMMGSSWSAANNAVFKNNAGSLGFADSARAGYISQYAFGSAAGTPQFNAQFSQVKAFGYLNPTLGATGAATAAQQTYSARSLMGLTSLGYASPIMPGGQQTSMSTIAQSIYARTFGRNAKLTPQQLTAALGQGGSLSVNLQAAGRAAGWSSSTMQEYAGYFTGLATAEKHGMSANKYFQLAQQAGANDKSAQAQLRSVGIGTSMFQNQNNLNATRATRQADILESLAPAFDRATQAVDKFSQALTNILKNTGLDKVIGTGAGSLAPFSNALSGLSGGVGAGLGLMGAARMFRGGGGLLGRLGGLFGRGGPATTANGALRATQGADGVWSVAGTGGRAAALGGALDLSGGALLGASGFGAAALGVGLGGHYLTKKYIKDKQKRKWANVGVDAGAGALTGAAIGSVVPVIGTGVGAAIGGVIGAGIGIFGGATGEGGVTGTTGNSARNSSIQGASTASAAQIIRNAETQLGVPYVWGGESPGKAFDCSGLTQWAYSKAGVKIPRVAADQQKIGTQVPTNKTQPGDLLFVGNPAHHVVMNAGNGKIIEAPHPGSHVLMRALNPSEFDSATRIVGSIGNMNSLLNGNNDNSTNTLNNQQNLAGGDLGNLGGTSEAATIASALASSAGSIPMVAQAQNSNEVTGAGTGSNPTPNGKNDKASLQAYAKALLGKYGWGNQWNSFNALVNSESSWDVHATNPSSGAYGLAQALPKSKYNSAGSDWQSNGDTQLRWMMDYIKSRYGSPNAAWSFHQKNNWYAAGAWNIDKDQDARIHKGEMIIPAQQAETIRQTLLNNTFNPNLQKATGSGNSHSISFGDININLPSTYSGTAQEAQDMGKTIVEAMEHQLRIKNLQIGQ